MTDRQVMLSWIRRDEFELFIPIHFSFKSGCSTPLSESLQTSNGLWVRFDAGMQRLPLTGMCLRRGEKSLSQY